MKLLRILFTYFPLVLAIFLFPKAVKAQDIGMSMMLFIPEGGEVSMPISPLSIRGVSLYEMGNVGLEFGASLYRMSGMNIDNIPFQSSKSLVNPFYSLFVPLEFVWYIPSKYFRFRLKAGGFAALNAGLSMHDGNFDRAIKDHFGYILVNSSSEISSSPVIGWQGGIEGIYYLTKKFGISVEAGYISGLGQTSINTTYDSMSADQQKVVFNRKWATDQGQLAYKGMEIALGVVLSR